jgi:hypothetical protein
VGKNAEAVRARPWQEFPYGGLQFLRRRHFVFAPYAQPALTSVDGQIETDPS